MARPTKVGLEYFPLDVDIEHDDKFGLVVATHGILGIGIVVRLLIKIYKKSYFYKWEEREQLRFPDNTGVDINQVNEVINTCLKWGFFDRNMFEKYNILTSHGIQIRYLEAVKRRKEVEVYKEYCLLSKKEINECDNIVIVNLNFDNDTIYLQSKVEESKLEDSEVEDSEVDLESNKINKIYNHYLSKNVINHKKLTNEIKNEVRARLKDYSVDELIKAIDNYSLVFFSNLHYFDHKYPLGDLMREKSISKFLDESDPINNFKDKNKEKKGVVPNGERADELDAEYNFDRECSLGF
ncbi:DUF4373 domain-containing protein [Rossellomorea sp. LjRoot5]|uniref:DUF4373 domain-containing protein n=1 Tax=Rossellomorea sp. LjRoot5 TaxID=3342331 RepID=UPI003ECD73AF